MKEKQISALITRTPLWVIHIKIMPTQIRPVNKIHEYTLYLYLR